MLTPAAGEPVTAESLGWQLRAALPPIRLHSVSLYDDEANVLWLSEGALGPDEHSVVIEAMGALAADTSINCHQSALEDGRVAIFLPVRSPQGNLVGLAMVLADAKSVNDGVIEKIVTPPIRTVMQKVAVLLRGAPLRGATGERPAVPIPELAAEPQAVAARPPATPNGVALSVAPARLDPDESPAPSGSSSPGPVLSAHQVNDILEFELTQDAPPLPTPASSPRATPLASAPPASASSPLASASSPPATLLASASSPRAVPPPSGSLVADHSRTLGAGTGSARVLNPAGTGATPALSAATTGSATALNLVATGSSKGSNATTGSSKALNPGATGTARTLALPEGVSLSLEVHPFSKLRAGGRTRRFEVQARLSHPNRVQNGLDNVALQRLLAWMGANRAAWSLEPTSFTLNLSIATLEDERFPQFVSSNLKAHGIAAESIGFEIAEALCLQRRAQVERFITLCDQLGCFVVIDDFSLESSVVSLLRSKALRAVKIDPKLTSVALKDKFAQAMVVAIVQAVKVLGIHCAAKRVDSPVSMQWLTAIGCDFAQGTALAQPQPIEALAAPGTSL